MDDIYVPPCNECGGRCCGYVAIEIDRPATKMDYDNIRWYLLHKKINVFIDHSRKWHIEFRTPCEKQLRNKKCGIYDTRPKICRDHGNEPGECEFYDSPYSHYFSDVTDFEKYMDARKRDWRFKRY